MLAQSSFTKDAWNRLLDQAVDRAELPTYEQHQALVATVDLPILLLDVSDVADMVDWCVHHGLVFNADSRAAYIGMRLIALSTEPQGTA